MVERLVAELRQIRRLHRFAILHGDENDYPFGQLANDHVQLTATLDELVEERFALLAEFCGQAIPFGAEILGLEHGGQLVPQSIHDAVQGGARRTPWPLASARPAAIGFVEIMDIDPVIRCRLAAGPRFEQSLNRLFLLVPVIPEM